MTNGRGVALWKRYLAEVLLRGLLRTLMMDSAGDNDDKLRWGLKELAEGDLPLLSLLF